MVKQILDNEIYLLIKYKKCSLESSETPALYRGCTVPKGLTCFIQIRFSEFMTVTSWLLICGIILYLSKYSMKITVYWDTTPYSLIRGTNFWRRLFPSSREQETQDEWGKNKYIKQNRKWLSPTHSEDSNHRYLCNNSANSLDHKVSHLKRQ